MDQINRKHIHQIITHFKGKPVTNNALLEYCNLHHLEPNIQGFPKKASTAMTKNTVVAIDSTGYLIPATSTTTPEAIAGIIQRDVASTDSDYAANTVCMVEVPSFHRDRFIADVEAGTVTQAMVGTRVDLNDASGVNVGGTVTKQVYIEALLNTTGGSAGLGQVVVSFPGINAA